MYEYFDPWLIALIVSIAIAVTIFMLVQAYKEYAKAGHMTIECAWAIGLAIIALFKFVILPFNE